MLICLAFIKENFPWPWPFISHCITFRNVCSTYWVLNLQDFASLRLTIKKPHLLLKILKIHGLVSTTQNPSFCFKPSKTHRLVSNHPKPIVLFQTTKKLWFSYTPSKKPWCYTIISCLPYQIFLVWHTFSLSTASCSISIFFIIFCISCIFSSVCLLRCDNSSFLS